MSSVAWLQAETAGHCSLIYHTLATFQDHWCAAFANLSMERRSTREQQSSKRELATFWTACGRLHGLHQSAVRLQADHGDDGSSSQVTPEAHAYKIRADGEGRVRAWQLLGLRAESAGLRGGRVRDSACCSAEAKLPSTVEASVMTVVAASAEVRVPPTI